MTDNLLELAGYGVGFAGKCILHDVNLKLPSHGVMVIMGPSGTGKSTLLRTLSGANDASPSLQVSGTALFQGSPLGELGLPAIVMQKARLMMAGLRENIVSELPERNSLQLSQQREIAARLLHNAGLGHLTDDLERRVIDLTLGEQRLVALVRTLASNPKVILVDEPTSGINDGDADKILTFLKQQSRQRAVVVVLHNQLQARFLGGEIALLVGGTTIEHQATRDFFAAPITQLAKDFVRTGSCCAPSPNASAIDLADGFSPYPEASNIAAQATFKEPGTTGRQIKNDAFGPRNFLWLTKGVLAGTPRPGLTLDLAFDLAALKRVGVSVLVSLESEAEPIAQHALAQYSIKGIAFPINDMGVPTLSATQVLCIEIETLIQQGEAIAFHCKAGIGRTGTMLVACLIWQGMSALNALETARKIEPRWVQSQAQVDFLENFEDFISAFSERSEKEGSASFVNLANNKKLRSYT